MNMTGTLNAVDEYVDALLVDLAAAELPPTTLRSLAPLAAEERDAGAAPVPPPAASGNDAAPPGVATIEEPSRMEDTAGSGAPAVAREAPAAANAPAPVAISAPQAKVVAMPLPPGRGGEAAPMPTASHTAPVQARPLVSSSQRWLRVAVGEDSYALELLSVQEVVRVAPIVAMRGAARAVLGVMNLRGRIVPVFDLGLWLDAGCVQADERSRIVVVERDDELIGVLVTLVEDVVTLGRERIEPPLLGTPQGAILGIARVGAAPTVLLDAGALFGGG